MGKELTKPVTGLDCLIPTTLETNVKYLHEFLFNDKDYQPSETVLIRSDFVAEKTGFGDSYVPEERKNLISDRSEASGSGGYNNGDSGDGDNESSDSGYSDGYNNDSSAYDEAEYDTGSSSNYSDNSYDVEEN